jgi:hypothetical protein
MGNVDDFQEDLDVFASDVRRVQLRHKIEAMVHLLESVEALEKIVSYIKKLDYI